MGKNKGRQFNASKRAVLANMLARRLKASEVACGAQQHAEGQQEAPTTPTRCVPSSRSTNSIPSTGRAAFPESGGLFEALGFGEIPAAQVKFKKK